LMAAILFREEAASLENCLFSGAGLKESDAVCERKAEVPDSNIPSASTRHK